MTIETTQPAIVSSPEDVQRRSYMTALSLAAQIMGETHALPNSFEVIVHPWAPAKPELRFYFHRDVPSMRQFRDDQMLTETMEPREDGSVYCEAVREDVWGVRVVAWTLTDAKAPAVAA
ncbi:MULTISPECIES: hypothetical protein [unclassified Streptomyces]|uniref:hypothetical protein n=1 Tax=unclassified Streptomyces TaxID=2593676 RepID=UPI002E281C07|nr:hypothetical protein [Streptomyces sp. NBC_00228]